ncbi:glycosyl hydrolase [Flavobacterium nitratireducens]|uniref:glycosyl hydrolase n=1 Tax=Flavobacterium nitratireducens TaxID=992289 RepID=UPI0024155468|nr:glycosyl hydrolase [Flavobacterium nitratireducens]
MKIKLQFIPFFAGILFAIDATAQSKQVDSAWPETKNVNKPWARWWWMGNAVDKPNLKSSLIDFQKVGIGGVEITPIYGVKGEEANFIDYLSPKYMEMLDYTVKIADSLGMQVDMVLGTGWPYGGPQVTLPYAAMKLVVEKYEVKKEDLFNKELKPSSEKDKIPAQLLAVSAFGADGSYLDLTKQLNGNLLQWKAANTDYTIYAIFAGKTGQQVKRAAPGGKGYTLDHYSEEALNAYVVPFDKALVGFEGKLRAIFNDSYEVYGTDFTLHFLEEFEKRRGYDLKKYLPQLLSKEDSEIGNRVKSDYRETISDLLLHKFDLPWTKWANAKNFKTKLQAHGSPGNLIDLYASADISECETFGSMPYDIPGFRREIEDIRNGDADPVMLKFSSSAAHIAGKPLTSSETFTWLRDHFKTALSQCKPEVEDLFLNGINHVFLHGSTYSPKRAEWPGWKFYASVNFNANNAIWEDAPGLFSYIANCQSLLQSGKSDNGTLLYYPVYDTWGKNLEGNLFFQFKIHSLDEWLHGTPFYKTTEKLMEKGYGVDFISDSFIAQATVKEGLLVLPGNSYKALVVPDCDKMPLATLEKLIALKKAGASIIFEGLPKSVPGLYNYEVQNEKMAQLIASNKMLVEPVTDVFKALTEANEKPETLVETGLKFIKRDVNGEKIYYLVNHTPKTIEGFIPLAVANKKVLILDPLTRKVGNAEVKSDGLSTMVKIRLESGKSLFLQTENKPSAKPWKYMEPKTVPIALKGQWDLAFEKGGPALPAPVKLDKLESWTKFSPEAEAFSGTATYTLQFDKPTIDAKIWQLNLGDVRESAKIWLNGKYIGPAWSVPFSIELGKLKRKQNELKIQVTNLSANRVRDLELKGKEWKIFYEINMVDKDYNKFDATKWAPMPSGLKGPVSITPLVENK